MTTASPEVTAIDTHARCPLLLLLASALAWLLVSGVLAVIASVQIHTPTFLTDCSVFTHGHVQAMQETTFVYGWLANAGIALGLWLLARLGGESLRAGNWMVVGTLFWNLALTVALIGIAVGDATGFSLFQLPRYVQPLMLVAFGAIGVAGVLAWSDRREETTFASQWYVFAALFLFPWIFSVAQVTLLWVPVRGVLQAIAAGWFAQSAYTLWLAPLALAGAYYVVPKVTGRVLPSYQFASLGFWTLAVIGPWTGGRHLIGGPVPAWISTMAIVSCSLLLFHYFVVALNLRGAFGGGGVALRLISFGLLAYVLGGFLNAVTSMRLVAQVTQFTFFDQAEQQLALYGAVSIMIFGTLYFALPRLTGKAWASGGLVAGHSWLAILGSLLLVVTLAVAGWVEGHALLDPKITFTQIATETRPWLVGVTVAHTVLLFANLLLAINFLRTVAAKSVVPAATLFNVPAEMEATVS